MILRGVHSQNNKKVVCEDHLPLGTRCRCLMISTHNKLQNQVKTLKRKFSFPGEKSLTSDEPEDYPLSILALGGLLTMTVGRVRSRFVILT